MADTQCWGEGGAGSDSTTTVTGAGGGGGEFAEETTLALTVSHNYSFTIGAGGTGTSTSFPGDSVTVTAHAGAAGSGTGNGGSGSTNSIHHNGGAGGGATPAHPRAGGSGGSSAGPSAAGNAGSANDSSPTSPPAGGGAGGAGGASGSPGSAGSVPGGGGGGAGDTSAQVGGAAASGQISITYTASVSGTATLAGVGTLTATGSSFSLTAPPPAQPSAPGRAWLQRFGFGRRHQLLPWRQTQTLTGTATLAGAGTLSAFGALPNPVVVNQWGNNYGQGTTFGSITSALQSNVISLTPGGSVGPGSGVPTPGNWLFAISSWTQDPSIAQVHVGTGDDIHSWWREFPASQGSGNVRTSVSYTPNIARAPGNVYVAPDMEIAAVNTLVVEVSGLGPWDTLTGTVSNYAAAATSLSLALGAPSQAAFTIAGFGGDNAASGQAFLPSGWLPLVTQTQTNGSDHLADNILTAAFLPSGSGSLSVSASAASENISGFMLQVLVGGTAPSFPSNANWPKFTVEAGFGSGFNTPDSEVTWTDITNRVWSFDETTGIQFQLGQVQATNMTMELDDFDGALIPPAPSAPWSFTASGTPTTHSYFTVTTAQSASIQAGDGFTDTLNSGTLFTVTSLGAPSGGLVNVSFTPSATTVMSSSDTVTQINPVAGTPVRIRAALGTLGGVTSNRWYVIQRNVMQWEERINEDYRRYVSATLTDIWAALSSTPPTFYRSEVYEDNPYAWFPLDDPAGIAGALPTQMLNAAIGNTNVMNVVVSPNGTGPEPTYGTDGTALNTLIFGQNLNPSLAVYTVGANSGWMFGDPPGQAATLATGNEVTPNPGSASWQVTGQQGNTGGFGWFLSAHDANFPALSGGITVGGWFNYIFFGTTTPVSVLTEHVLAQQPYCPLTLMTLATNSAPVAVLQMDVNGHLNLITYNGGTGTSHSIYSAADLRAQSWFSVTMTLTTTTWTVWVDGGATAKVSGTATGMTSAWTYLIVNGDMGASGGASPASIQHSGNMAASHIQVFPYVLPYYRIMDHYWAAVTGFGLLPAPQAVALQPVHYTSSPPTVSPDGQFMDPNGAYGQSSGGFGGQTVYTMSGVVEAVVAGYNSGPSAYGTVTGVPQVNMIGIGDDIYISWTGLSAAFAVYNATSVGQEVQARITIADSDTLKAGYGASTNAFGIGDTGAGNGSAVPAASQIGDTAGQRIERLMRGGRTASPNRCIDPAPLPVQAPGTAGGSQQAGEMIQQIQQSDGGMLYVDNVGHLTYWQRPHLASQYSSPVWTLTPNAPPTAGAPLTAVPYYPGIRVITDPQRVWNNIIIQPFDPAGAQLPLITPTDATDVNASQVRYGAQPLNITSWLQSTSEMQNQANWLFANFGQPQRHAENVRVDAAPYPAAWSLVMGINVGDVLTVADWQIGGGGNVNTFRVTEIHREVRFGGRVDGDASSATVTGSVTILGDFEPPTWWS